MPLLFHTNMTPYGDIELEIDRIEIDRRLSLGGAMGTEAE